MADVTELDVLTTLDIPADKVLKAALDQDLSDVVIIGYDSDGKFYFASSAAQAGEVLYLLEMGKLEILRVKTDG